MAQHMKADPTSKDLRVHFVRLGEAENASKRMQQCMKSFQDDGSGFKANLERLCTQVIETHSDAAAKIIKIAKLPCIAAVSTASTAKDEFDAITKINACVAKTPNDPSQWRDPLLALVRSEACTALIKLVGRYDDAASILSKSVGDYKGGVKALWSDDQEWQESVQIMTKIRQVEHL